MPEQLINIKELARRLGMARGTLYNWVYQDRLVPIRVGRCLRFDYEEVIRSLSQLPAGNVGVTKARL
jgi:excisionase family DNA binding protein